MSRSYRYINEYKNTIVELRKQGKSFNEIKNILNCSKSTISYYCSPNQKDKIAIRKTKYS